MIPPVHELWDHVIQVEVVNSMNQIELECEHESDEEPLVFQHICDLKWNRPQDNEGLT